MNASESIARYIVQRDGTADDLAMVLCRMASGATRECLQIHFPGTVSFHLKGAPEGVFAFESAPYRSKRSNDGSEFGTVAFEGRMFEFRREIPAVTLEEACAAFFHAFRIENYVVLPEGSGYWDV